VPLAKPAHIIDLDGTLTDFCPLDLLGFSTRGNAAAESKLSLDQRLLEENRSAQVVRQRRGPEWFVLLVVKW
jgi:hypothetical protein